MASKKHVKFGEPKYEEMVLRWADECEDLPSGESEISEVENDDIMDSDFEANCDEFSESSNEDDDDDDADASAENVSVSSYISASNLEWKKEPPAKSKVQPHNIIRRAPGLAKKHMSATPKEAIQLFLTEAIMQEIVHCTNLEARRVYNEKSKT